MFRFDQAFRGQRGESRSLRMYSKFLILLVIAVISQTYTADTKA
jgi:hypothetical protein